MIRSFLPVGQGAFYVEQFDDGTNVIYDCGSTTDVNIVNKEIKYFFESGQPIKYMFISHFHEDHINGLKYLFHHCKVENIYIPYVKPKDKLLLHIANLIENGARDSFVHDFIENPEQVITTLSARYDRITPNIFYVVPLGSEEAATPALVQNIHRSGQHVSIKEYDWIYVPFNFDEGIRSDKFMEQLRLQGISHSVLENNLKFSNYWFSQLDKLKNAYRKIPGGLNVNSLVVYSGPAMDYEKIVCYPTPAPCYGPYGYCCHNYLPVGCLYTGDYNASGAKEWEELRNSFNSYWDSIGLIQIPHHGSKHNFNCEFSKNNSAFIISSGFSNKYRHPHTQVLKEIINNKIPLFWVTEQRGSITMFNIDMR